MAPQRKEHEQIIGEDVDWQLTETARDEIDDEEVELRLVRECEECQGSTVMESLTEAWRSSCW